MKYEISFNTKKAVAIVHVKHAWFGQISFFYEWIMVMEKYA